MVKGNKVTIVEETEQEPTAAGSEGESPVEGAVAETATEAAPEADIAEEAGGDALQTRLQKAEDESRNNYDRFVRVSAEFDNYKKRSAREMEEFRKFSTEKLIKELLPVVDNLERALISAEHPSAEERGIKEGVELTLREILRVLERFGVHAIESLNEPFDPTYHQAMMQEPRDDVPANTVISELQKGYTMHDRLVRPAMVVVSAPTASREQEKDAGQSG